MAQNENYSQVDLRVGTEEQFNAKVGTLPAGTLFGTTDSTVSKADLSTDLKNEINGKINKPANPTSDSAVVINSSGEISTKPLSDIAGKAEVSVSTTQPAASSSEVLWINPDGTGGGGSSSGGGKLYLHSLEVDADNYPLGTVLYSTDNTPVENGETFLRVFGSQASCIALASTDPSPAITEPSLYWSEGDQGCKVSYLDESGNSVTATNVTIYDTVTGL